MPSGRDAPPPTATGHRCASRLTCHPPCSLLHRPRTLHHPARRGAHRRGHRQRHTSCSPSGACPITTGRARALCPPFPVTILERLAGPPRTSRSPPDPSISSIASWALRRASSTARWWSPSRHLALLRPEAFGATSHAAARPRYHPRQGRDVGDHRLYSAARGSPAFSPVSDDRVR